MSPPEPVGLEALLEPHSEQVVRIFRAVRSLVLDVMPGVTEQVDLPDRLLAFGYGPGGGVRMRGLALALIPHTAHVNVQLADGAQLPDRNGIVEGTGKRIRHVKCRSLEDVRRPALRALIEAEADLRKPAAS
jgi:hypothetical protein